MESERRRSVLAGLESLPDVQRMVFYLYYWMGRPVAEISELLELSREAVKSHLFRGRRLLAGRLKEAFR